MTGFCDGCQKPTGCYFCLECQKVHQVAADLCRTQLAMIKDMDVALADSRKEIELMREVVEAAKKLNWVLFEIEDAKRTGESEYDHKELGEMYKDAIIGIEAALTRLDEQGKKQDAQK